MELFKPRTFPCVCVRGEWVGESMYQGSVGICARCLYIEHIYKEVYSIIGCVCMRELEFHVHCPRGNGIQAAV